MDQCLKMSRKCWNSWTKRFSVQSNLYMRIPFYLYNEKSFVFPHKFHLFSSIFLIYPKRMKKYTKKKEKKSSTFDEKMRIKKRTQLTAKRLYTELPNGQTQTFWTLNTECWWVSKNILEKAHQKRCNAHMSNEHNLKSPREHRTVNA